MKEIRNLNISHSVLGDEVIELIKLKEQGKLSKDEIFCKTDMENDKYPFSITVPTHDLDMCYKKFKYEEFVEDYLKLMVMLNFKTTDDLWDEVRNGHENEDGFIVIEGCYTNDPNEEYTHIGTVSPDGIVENIFGEEVEDLAEYGYSKSVINAIKDALKRQKERVDGLRTFLIQELCKNESRQNMEKLILSSSFDALMKSLDDERKREFALKTPA